MNSFRIDTPRLVLRDPRAEDGAAIHAFRSDPATIRFMQMAPETAAESQRWLESVLFHNAQQPRTSWNLVIARREDDRAIGWIGFGDSERHPGPENYGVGYMLASSVWRRGYATEALRAVIDHVFTRRGGTMISAWCFAENGASERVMQKAGMTFARKFIEPDDAGQPRPCREYAVTRATREPAKAILPT